MQRQKLKEKQTQAITRLIPEKSRVLDLGCGDGSLLAHLKKTKAIQGYGIEIDFQKIQDCTKKGISVFQGDIHELVSEFADKSFDVVILSQTLQEILTPLETLEQLLRVGKKVILSFPNFAYWPNRLQFLLSGHSPKTKNLPYEWYNTPNIRVITINDFKEACQNMDIVIENELPLYNSSFLSTVVPNCLSNLLCQQGTFLLSR